MCQSHAMNDWQAKPQSMKSTLNCLLIRKNLPPVGSCKPSCKPMEPFRE
ncbi:hypothetical protein BVRB_7g158930 [Beta vulgaris subsp. vulgaris]|nr:hypothetical protein BVRB_7g158930 [Beta vulgaris subsp. vulgaris]